MKSPNRPLRTQYIVYLMAADVWLGENRHWEQERANAKRFATFREAEEASEGYSVSIKTVEESL
jgi:hypothetical protein